MNSNDEIIQLKLNKAKALFAEIDVLMQNEFYNTAINRLYYACFHVTNALLLTENLKSKTHSGTASLLYQNFVSKNKVDVNKSTFYSNLIRLRMDSDYSDFLIADKEEVKELIQPAKEYLDYIISLIPPPGTQDTANNPAP